MISGVAVHHAEILTSEGMRETTLLGLGREIAQIGEVNLRHFDSNIFSITEIDAKNCFVLPGIVDSHQHFLGGSGERGYATQTPEISFYDQIRGGITTSVGCLGVDTSTRTMQALLAKAKAFNEEHLTSFIYSGGYTVPPATLTGSVKTDMIYCPEVIGAGEVAIADVRSSQPTVQELARIVSDAYVGGILTRKSGLTHIHVGPGRERLKILRALISDFEVYPESLHPTHMSRTESLLTEGIEFVKLGGTIDLDVEDQDLLPWLKFYLDHGGKKEFITASSDASIISPSTLFMQVRNCFLEGNLPLELIYALVSVNPSRILKLSKKGKLFQGADSDFIIVDKKDFQIRDVYSLGRCLMKDYEFAVKPLSLAHGNRGNGKNAE